MIQQTSYLAKHIFMITKNFVVYTVWKFLKNKINFREQNGRGPGGYYEANLIWKENHLPLQDNESSSSGRLHNLIRN